jgi:beta-lactamase class A
VDDTDHVAAVIAAGAAAVASAVDAAVDAAADVEWSICVRSAGGGAVVGHQADTRLRTASVGKLILLAEVARRVELDPSYGDRRLRRDSVEPIADSGLLQHLGVEELSVDDLAVLVGSVSDNWATNILLQEVGLPAVAETGRRLGLTQTELLDRVRRPRTPQDPPALSYGTAAELSGLMASLHRGEVVSEAVSRLLLRWLAAGVDLSMVASAFGLDPLAHQEIDRGFRVVNKTGTDAGIRADVGFVEGPAGHLSYAAIANWPDSASGGQESGPDRRDLVLTHLRRIGDGLRTAVDRGTSPGV